MVTIILTVSRDTFLYKIITSLELLECNQNEVNILCIVDGSTELYVKTRNLVADMKYKNRLTVHYKDGKLPPRFDINTRRKRIAGIHNFAKQHLADNQDFIFSVEDDTTFGRNTLKKLLKVAAENRAFGMAEGVELGRWGVPYVGAWVADDIYNLKELKSLKNIKNPLESRLSRIDAGGLYCALIKADLYKQHNFTCSNGLGPDVNLGIELRQLGFDNFIVWSIHCNHHYEDKGEEKILSAKEDSKEVTMTKLNDKKWKVTY